MCAVEGFLSTIGDNLKVRTRLQKQPCASFGALFARTMEYCKTVVATCTDVSAMLQKHPRACFMAMLTRFVECRIACVVNSADVGTMLHKQLSAS